MFWKPGNNWCHNKPRLAISEKKHQNRQSIWSTYRVSLITQFSFLLISVRERESKFIARYLNRKVGRLNSSLMEVHEEKCNSKTLIVSYVLWWPHEFIEILIMAQKNAKELHFWQSINKMNDIGNALQLASSHKVFSKLLYWKFLSEGSTSASLVQALEQPSQLH